MLPAASNAYTHAPELGNHPIIGSLRLLFWLFFHPSAWRNHLRRIDPKLIPNFCLADLSWHQWQNGRLRRLLFMVLLPWPLLTALLLTLLLLLLNAPVENIIIGLLFGLTVGILAGLVAAAVGSLPVGVAVGFSVMLVTGGGSGFLFTSTSFAGGTSEDLLTAVIGLAASSLAFCWGWGLACSLPFP